MTGFAMSTEQAIQQSLGEVRDTIAETAKNYGREPGDVQLVAVGKTFDADCMRAALSAGQRVFGENRVQEAAGKWPDLRAEYPDLELHLIGPLQTNKVKQALELFDVIQTVDRPKLAKALARDMEKMDRHPRLFIQVNTGEEEQKAGVLPADADAFIKECRDGLGLPIVGLMCIPPVEAEPSLHFALLRKIAQRNGLTGLSMGMSGDYDVAVQFGATHVRVGSAIFGKRDYPA